jgi:hypothetical protein
MMMRHGCLSWPRKQPPVPSHHRPHFIIGDGFLHPNSVTGFAGGMLSVLFAVFLRYGIPLLIIILQKVQAQNQPVAVVVGMGWWRNRKGIVQAF